MRARYLVVAVVVAVVSTSGLARGDSGRRGGRGSGHSRSGGSAGARYGSSASSSRSGYDRSYRSAVPRYSSNRGVTTRYSSGGGRSYRNYRYSSYRSRPFYRPYYRSYYRPSFFGGLYLSSPWYYDSYYDGGYYPETYAYPPYASDYGYREPPPDVGRDFEQDAADDREADRDESYDDRNRDVAGDNRDAGRLRLQIQPPDAAIYVDDQFRGTAGRTTVLTLAAGRHTLEVARPGFQSERREVEVRNGEARSLSIALQRAYR